MALFFDAPWFDGKLAERGLSRAVMAAVAGLSEAELAEVFKDQREVSAGQVAAFAELLGGDARRGGGPRWGLHAHADGRSRSGPGAAGGGAGGGDRPAAGRLDDLARGAALAGAAVVAAGPFGAGVGGAGDVQQGGPAAQAAALAVLADQLGGKLAVAAATVFTKGAGRNDRPDRNRQVRR